MLSKRLYTKPSEKPQKNIRIKSTEFRACAIGLDCNFRHNILHWKVLQSNLVTVAVDRFEEYFRNILNVFICSEPDARIIVIVEKPRTGWKMVKPAPSRALYVLQVFPMDLANCFWTRIRSITNSKSPMDYQSGIYQVDSICSVQFTDNCSVFQKYQRKLSMGKLYF